MNGKIHILSFVLIFIGATLASCAPSVRTVELKEIKLEAQTTTEVFQKAGCGACHSIPGIYGAVGEVGPDLSNIGKTAKSRIVEAGYAGAAKNEREYIFESMADPNLFVVKDCPDKPCQAWLMPVASSAILTDDEVNIIVAYLASLPEGAALMSDLPTP